MKHLYKFDGYNDFFQNLRNFEYDNVVSKISRWDYTLQKTMTDIIYGYDKYINNEKYTKDDYLTIYTLTSGSLRLNLPDRSDGTNLYYSINNGPWTLPTNSTWTTIDNIAANSTIRLKGDLNFYNTSRSSSSSVFYYSGYFVLYGNINSLIALDNWDDPNIEPYTAPYMFSKLFYNNYYLLSIKNLSLPTTCTSTATYCFDRMFGGCSRLLDCVEEIPQLNSSYCASFMFSECRNMSFPSLSTVPTIYANGEYCCYSMFQSSGIQTLPQIQEINSYAHEYEYMFNDCKNFHVYLPDNFWTGFSMSEAYKFRGMFYGSNIGLNDFNIDGKDVGEYAFQETFRSCSFSGCPFGIIINPTSIGSYGFDQTFRNSNLTSKILIDLPEATTSLVFNYTFSETKIDAVQIQGCSQQRMLLNHTFENCTELEDVSIFWDYYNWNIEYYTNTPLYSTFVGCSKLKEIYFATNGTNQTQISLINVLPDTNGTLYVLNASMFDSTTINGWTLSDTVVIDYSIFGGDEWSLPHDLASESENMSESDLFNEFYNPFSSGLVILFDPTLHKMYFVTSTHDEDDLVHTVTIKSNNNVIFSMTETYDPNNDSTSYTTTGSLSQLTNVSYHDNFLNDWRRSIHQDLE